VKVPVTPSRRTGKCECTQIFWWSARKNLKKIEARNNFPRRWWLWEQSADEGSLRDATNSENHGASAWRYVVFAHGVHHFVEGADHDALEAQIDLFGIPEQAFLILHPLEIADGNAAGVGQDIWQDGNSTACKNFVRVWSSWAISSFGDNAGLDGFGVI
jgi:hypothetical protein